MKSIEVNCPAKINLTLEIVNRREDGFHNIKSIMQTISLYDTLKIKTNEANATTIKLSGNSQEIPYNEKNLVYKATDLFMKEANLNAEIEIYIDKKIPVSAGLAGGSTNAAGTLKGLNEIFDRSLSHAKLLELCALLGSDLNVCMEGGCVLATSRGEITQKIDTDINYPVTLIKPKNLGISAKEAYMKYATKTEKPKYNMTEKMLEAIKNNQDIREFLYNDLEYAIFDDYAELQEIKSNYPESIMSGSGSTYYILNNINKDLESQDYQLFEGIEFTHIGVNCNNFVIN